MKRTGAEILCAEIAHHGIEHVFGVAGSALVDLWEAMRRDPRVRVVGATSELTAAFMANGYARGSGRTAVLSTITGPGVTFAASGIAEARLGSVPLVYVVDAGMDGPSSETSNGVLVPLVKEVIDVASADDMAAATRAAFVSAREGDPGPVALRVHADAFSGSADAERAPDEDAPAVTFDAASVARRVRDSRRPVLLVGTGAADAAESVVRLAERLGAPVLTTTSGRGVVPETHPLSIVSDAPWEPIDALNDLFARSDLVLALGCKLSRNGSRAYGLRLAPDRLVRVDTSLDTLDARYPASLEIECDVGRFVSALAPLLDGVPRGSEWTTTEIEAIRERLITASPRRLNPTLGPQPAREFFAALLRQLPERAVVTTDSGLHQYVARAHFRVVHPRTFLVPTGFQSMGFGIPAAIGAGIATGRPAVAVVGDGSLGIVGLELMTALRERVPLTVLVLVDGHFGLIRLSQRARTGRDSGVEIGVPDLAGFSRSLGVEYVVIDGTSSVDDVLGSVLRSSAVTLVEVPTGDPPDLGWTTKRGRAYAAMRRTFGDGPLAFATRRRRRR